jgi:hypothetical protein
VFEETVVMEGAAVVVEVGKSWEVLDVVELVGNLVLEVVVVVAAAAVKLVGAMLEVGAVETVSTEPHIYNLLLDGAIVF